MRRMLADFDFLPVTAVSDCSTTSTPVALVLPARSRLVFVLVVCASFAQVLDILYSSSEEYSQAAAGTK